MMRPVQHTVRLPFSLDKALRALAQQGGVSVYSMLQRSVQIGVASLTSPQEQEALEREIVTELASMSTRLVEMERVVDRVLFTACASYCYARSVALGQAQPEDELITEIHAAYARQQRLAREWR